jgi:hypothetical protein
MACIIVKNNRPLRLENALVDGGVLVFATEQEAEYYGARGVDIFNPVDFGIDPTPNVRAVDVTEDDCSFEFKCNGRWQ